MYFKGLKMRAAEKDPLFHRQGILSSCLKLILLLEHSLTDHLGEANTVCLIHQLVNLLVVQGVCDGAQSLDPLDTLFQSVRPSSR